MAQSLSGAIHGGRLQSTLRAHRNDPDALVAFITLVIGNAPVAGHEAAVATALVTAMREHRSHVGVQGAGCEALAKLSKASAAFCGAACSAGGVDAVVGALRALPPDDEERRDETIIMACGALSYMSAHSLPESAHAAGLAGAVEAVVAALFALPLVGPVACQALNKLTEAHPSNMQRAVQAGAVTAVVAALNECGARDAMLVPHASFLNRLAWSDTPEYRAEVVAAGAIEAILAAVRAHPAAADVQAQGCRALGNIYQKSKRLADARDAALGAQVVHAAVQALEAHRGDADAQLYGCLAIWCALGDGDVSCGDNVRAVRAVVAALAAQPADAMVQNAGCRALDCLCQDDNAHKNQAAARAAGGFDAVVAALRAHAANVHVQQSACDALFSMLPDEEGRAEAQAAARAAGAIDATIAAQRAHPAHASVLHSSSIALAALVEDNPCSVRAARAAGAIEVIAAAFSAKFDDALEERLVRAESGVALDVLIDGDAAAAARAVRAGAAETTTLQDLIISRRDDGDQLPQRPDAAEEEERFEAATATHTHESLQRLFSALQEAAQRHDAGVCAEAACVRCAACRACGAMCARPGCGLRKRADGSGKTLLRCGRCRVRAYCGVAHQRDDWARHKGECGAPCERSRQQR